MSDSEALFIRKTQSREDTVTTLLLECSSTILDDLNDPDIISSSFSSSVPQNVPMTVDNSSASASSAYPKADWNHSANPHSEFGIKLQSSL